jgi:hypothetical protein
MALLVEQGRRVAAILHLVAPGAAGSRALRQLCNQLEAAGSAGARQLLLEAPGAQRNSQVGAPHTRLRLSCLHPSSPGA